MHYWLLKNQLNYNSKKYKIQSLKALLLGNCIYRGGIKKSLKLLDNLFNDQIDSFGFHRSSYFEQENNKTFIERLIEYGHKFQENSIQKIPQLPFGEKELELTIQKPSIGDIDHWSKMETMLKEKEVCGIFVTANPLDDYSLEIKRYCNTGLCLVFLPKK